MLYTTEYAHDSVQAIRQGEIEVEQAIHELAAALSHQVTSKHSKANSEWRSGIPHDVTTQEVNPQNILFDLQVGEVRWLLLSKPTGDLYREEEAQEMNRKNEWDRSESSLLSPREQEIAAMVANGHADQTIAAKLAISVWTINTYMRRIFAKLGVNTRAAMIARLADEGLLRPVGQ